MSTERKEQLTPGARMSLLEHGPRALVALDRMIEAADRGAVSYCTHCELRKVQHFRNEQVRVQLASMRDKLARFVSEAHRTPGGKP